MSLHQARLLAGTPEKGTLDPMELDAWRSGERDLFRAIGADVEVVAQLRLQALALFEAAKWSRARDVVVGLAAMGSIHAVDALILDRAARELAQEETARAAAVHAERLLLSIGVTLPAEPKIATLRSLLEQFPAESAVEAKAEWESQRRLASAIKSFECMTAAIAGGADAPARIEAALAAAGACAATNAFPKQTLRELAKVIRAAATSRAAPAPAAAKISSTFAREAKSVDGRALAAFDRCVEQAIAAPNYCVTRSGWHYPKTRADYLARRYEPELVWLSEERWDFSWSAAEKRLARALAQPAPQAREALESVLIDTFFIEIGFDRRRLPRAPAPSPAAITAAIEGELVIPLRAINETLLDYPSRDELRGLADEVIASIASGRREIDHALLWTGGFDTSADVLLRALAAQKKG